MFEKEQLIEDLKAKAVSMMDSSFETEIVLTDNHGRRVASNDILNELNGAETDYSYQISRYVEALEYSFMVDNHGSINFEDEEYTPSEEALETFSELVGSPFEFSGLTISIESKSVFDPNQYRS